MTHSEGAKRHKEEMAARRIRQNERQSDVWWPFSKNTIPAYRKSIWPEGKVAKPGRMG